jgi:tetratricopeptide (TPR) repeat protein
LPAKPSVLNVYRQYYVLLEVKKQIRMANVSDDKKFELISFAEELSPFDSEIILAKAALFKRLGDIEGEKAALLAAMEASPSSDQAPLQFGKLLIESGNSREGRQYCSLAVKLNPINLEARSCAGH